MGVEVVGLWVVGLWGWGPKNNVGHTFNEAMNDVDREKKKNLFFL